MRDRQKYSIFRPLNPEKTFASFVSDQNNQDAYDLCKSVASNAGNLFNPLIICGSAGFGKTHLLHAIGNHCIAKSSKCRARYATLFDFTNEMIESIRKKIIRNFWRQFQSIDMLLLDDIEKDESKPRLLAYLTCLLALLGNLVPVLKRWILAWIQRVPEVAFTATLQPIENVR